MSFKKTTEQDSNYDHLEEMSTSSLLENINNEDQKVALAVKKVLNKIGLLVDIIAEKLANKGRLFYLGAGTSGRLGILDASECPPTFGVSHDLVIGLIAGGDSAIRKAVEFAEDDTEQGWKDLKEYQINEQDVVIGIAASGTTPYVIGALESCNKNNITTGCITCNEGSPLAQVAQYPIEVVVGPEFVTGSSRMKAGTAQKLILNMITTTTMIKLGRVKGNKMVDMQLSNNKLVDRGTRMIMQALDVDRQTAANLLKQHQSVRTAVNYYKNAHR
ncbi:N-acetylmuramic acid 6-phosphate etherase [Spongiivirga sp. MCCC 1A20706]|uniref:N-acetylmuramic acid 6-phosphate etherase n=1 Tax=Spongiivirga sp. MCCC 1A20706 TaxID=3160963 RepID=UPI003977BAF4